MLSPNYGLWEYDREALGQCAGIVGVDEAGRGALAGPVVAACVWVKAEAYSDDRFYKDRLLVNDSKKLRPKQRQVALEKIKEWESLGLLKFLWAQASVAEIDVCNIAGATRLAMRRCIDTLMQKYPNLCRILTLEEESTLFPSGALPELQSEFSRVLIDGLPLRSFYYTHEGIPKGDAKSLAIAMASIVAKTQRDALMEKLNEEYPQYKFHEHKGYGTPTHQKMIMQFGASDIHRTAFLQRLLSQSKWPSQIPLPWTENL